jgi:prepilin-type N-terminal cleavage/methylation domain-containing protein
MNSKKGLARRSMTEGFTLVELMVVVGIIAILSAVVLAALTSGRNKGNDAGIKTNLHTIANQAEIFYTDNNNSYLPMAGGAIRTLQACPATYKANGTNMLSQNKTISDALIQATSLGNICWAYVSTNTWAVAIGLKSDSASSWCVDNAGASKQESFTPDLAIDNTTFNCK